MLVSGGYPGNYEKGKAISGLGNTSDSIVFHAGTKPDGDEVLTNGGRVLAVSSYGRSLPEALEGSYRNARLLSFEGSYFRSDIGFDL
jgi:phosphoribosylamine--glycine ligase